MINARFLAAALVAGAAVATSSFAQTSLDADRPALADFRQRVQSYVDLRDTLARTVPPLRPLADPGEIRHTSDVLAEAIQHARAGARQGDIFSTGIARIIRRAVRAGCDDNYADVLTLLNADLDAPLPRPVVNGRWPAGAALPTMLPDMLAALPKLPPGLEYRFMRWDLVLRDIDANLIVDFVPDVIPVTINTASR